MARKAMMAGKGNAKVVKPTNKAVYKKRVAKPEPDRIPAKPKQRSNFPKGFI